MAPSKIKNDSEKIVYGFFNNVFIIFYYFGVKLPFLHQKCEISLVWGATSLEYMRNGLNDDVVTICYANINYTSNSNR